jgi:hypothetical protein
MFRGTPEGMRRGFMLQRRRMGMWKARVVLDTRSRKKRYWRMRGWVCKTAALVWGMLGVVVECFSMRAQVR